MRLDCVSPGRREGRVTIDRNGVAIDPRHPPSGRGVRIEMAFACEEGHAFAYALQFHKGATELEALAGAHGGDAWTIWRE